MGPASVGYNREQETEFTTKLSGPRRYISLQSHTQASACLWLYKQDIVVMLWEILIGLAELAHFQISHETGLLDTGNSYLNVFLKCWWAKLPLWSAWKWRASWYPLDSQSKTESSQLWQEEVLQGTWEELERLSENAGLVHCLWISETTEVKRALGDQAMRDFTVLCWGREDASSVLWNCLSIILPHILAVTQSSGMPSDCCHLPALCCSLVPWGRGW